MMCGYAAAADPDSLQLQVEALEDMGIPTDHQYVELIKYGQSDREQFDRMLKTVKQGDNIAIYNLTALGFSLQESYDRLCKLDKKHIQVNIYSIPDGESQAQILKIFLYIAEMYSNQRQQELTRGHPQKAYPPGWRGAYHDFLKGKKSASEICAELKIPDYDFYRMRQRYEKALAERKKSKKNR